MNTCNFCEKVFKRRDNLVRHKKNVHQQEDQTDSESDRELNEDSDADKPEEDTYDPWESIVQKTFDQCREEFEEYTINLIEKRHMDQMEARHTAYKDLQPKFRKVLRTLFNNRMTWFNAMERDPVYKTIQKTVNNLMELDDFDRREAWTYAISKRKYLFDAILEDYDPPAIEEDARYLRQGNEPPTKKMKV